MDRNGFQAEFCRKIVCNLRSILTVLGSETELENRTLFSVLTHVYILHRLGIYCNIAKFEHRDFGENCVLNSFEIIMNRFAWKSVLLTTFMLKCEKHKHSNKP